MKNILKIFVIAPLCFAGLCSADAQPITSADVVGAWEFESEQIRTTMICTNNFFTVAVYQIEQKKFLGTYGGVFRIEDKKFIEVLEFNTLHQELVGKEIRYDLSLDKGKLTFMEANQKTKWNKVDDGKPGALAGAWLITARVVNNENQTITPAARKTMKILSGTRFQWIAYNSETGEFFGTGGGTYTTIDGKYTESLLFFSRDNNRVGATLRFDFLLEEGKWRHQGLSSKGDPIDEVWSKRDQLGI